MKSVLQHPPIDIDRLHEEIVAIHMQDGGNIRVHPNGFIQLDLEPVEESWHASHKKGHSGAGRRLHVWNPPGVELPHQETVNEIHTHVFDMRSTIVKGMLFQCLYELQPNPQPTHEEYRAIYAKNSDSRLEPSGRTGTIELVEHFGVRAGFSYTQRAHTFHDTKTPGLCMTVMEKTTVYDGDAYVLCPTGQPPDNDFDRASAAPSELLWDAVERSFDA